MQALVIALVIIVLDKRGNLCFEIAGQIIVLQQNSVFERLVPALDLSLSLRMIWRAAHMAHVLTAKPKSQFSGDIAGPIV